MIPMEKDVKDFLSNIGCCWRCMQIYLGHSSIENFKSSNGSLNGEFSDQTPESLTGDAGNIVVDLESTKRIKMITCLSCLGLLQNCCLHEAVSVVASAINEGGYDSSIFSLGISLPVCLPLRIHCIWVHLLKKFPNINSEPARTNHLGVLKDVFRNLVGPKVSTKVHKTFVTGQNISFNVGIASQYADDEQECLILEKINEKKFRERRKHHRKFAEGVFTKQAVEETLKEVADAQFLSFCPSSPLQPQTRLQYSQINCSRASIYLAGRYTKHSRELPQTPWFVDGARRCKSSVQELICEPLNLSIRAEGVKFSASGREDVDVRCLGLGRPFVVEFLNPRKVKLTQDDLAKLQDEVNTSTEEINIRDLQIVLKKDTVSLKEGEEDKMKTYCALCFSEEDVTDVLQKVEGIKPLVLDQLTPLRVLHRRPLALRKRTVQITKVQQVDEHIFKLYVTTQAGTYVKEFVHGDFGRTNPNMGSLLGIKCDILALDVEEVKLDWPPPTLHRS